MSEVVPYPNTPLRPFARRIGWSGLRGVVPMLHRDKKMPERIFSRAVGASSSDAINEVQQGHDAHGTIGRDSHHSTVFPVGPDYHVGERGVNLDFQFRATGWMRGHWWGLPALQELQEFQPLELILIAGIEFEEQKGGERLDPFIAERDDVKVRGQFGKRQQPSAQTEDENGGGRGEKKRSYDASSRRQTASSRAWANSSCPSRETASWNAARQDLAPSGFRTSQASPTCSRIAGSSRCWTANKVSTWSPNGLRSVWTSPISTSSAGVVWQE